MVYIRKKLTTNPSICQGIQDRIPNQPPDFFLLLKTEGQKIFVSICQKKYRVKR